jgi:aminoglycoside phosphotransferase (APT) family kinase protein
MYAAGRTERDGLVWRLVEGAGPELDGCEVTGIAWSQHSNDVARVDLDDGRVLMVKLARFDWVAPGFRAERLAAERLNRVGVLAPRHLRVPDRVGGRPVLCYWRIPLETLASVWPSLGELGRSGALRSWGRLLRRVHDVPLDEVGRLGSGADESIAAHLARDLDDRLRWGVAGEWPEGSASLERALEVIPELERRTGERPTVLLHGDPHARNIMVRAEGGMASCDGLIDLESAWGGPPEMDLAHARVLHGPHFDQQLDPGWFDELAAGYGETLDPFLLEWFALYHLLNLGFYSALVGHPEHAADVARAAAGRAERLVAGPSGTAPAAIPAQGTRGRGEETWDRSSTWTSTTPS